MKLKLLVQGHYIIIILKKNGDDFDITGKAIPIIKNAESKVTRIESEKFRVRVRIGAGYDKNITCVGIVNGNFQIFVKKLEKN